MPAPTANFSASRQAPSWSAPFTAALMRYLNSTWQGAAAFVVVVAAFVAADPSVASLAVGAVMSVIGEGVRIVAAGYGYKIGELSLDGPYRVVRHPYFLGSALLFLGICIASRNALVAAGATALLAAAYAGAIRADEERRRAALGPAFATYRATVPAILPKLFPAPLAGTARREFSLRLAIFTGRHREFDALFGLTLAFIIFYIALKFAAYRPYFRLSVVVLVGVYVAGRFIYHGVVKRRPA